MTKKPGSPKAGAVPSEGRARALHAKVRKKNIKASSRRWIERQLNDPYVHKARADGYRSRAAYKLVEINDRYKLLKSGQLIMDLGCAPGGWCQVAARIAGSTPQDIKVVGIDYLPVDAITGVTLLEMDFLDDAAPDKLLEALGGRPDIVLSDMAAPTTGHRRTDHLRTMHLAEVAAEFTLQVLKPGGHFLTKTFQGGTENELLSGLKKRFTSVHHVKPPASREESVELYLLARQFKG
jgi:23S rRNA (uridine2552-2'-O)-methyltransferase